MYYIEMGKAYILNEGGVIKVKKIKDICTQEKLEPLRSPLLLPN